MAKITNAGIIPTSLGDYLVQLQNGFKQAFGNDFDTDPQTPQGQIIALFALSLSNNDEALVSLAQSNNRNLAFGRQLDGINAILDIERLDSQKTQVEATLTGVASSLIPKGSKARSVAGELFQSTEDVTLASNGKATVQFEAITAGDIILGANQLNSIVDAVTGWETVDNDSVGKAGRVTENDAEYRNRYSRALSENSIGLLNSQISSLLNVAGVTRVSLQENDTSEIVIRQGVELPAHSTTAIVLGGSDIDIANVIALKKNAGVATNGLVSVSLPTVVRPIKFYRPNIVNFTVDLTVARNQNPTQSEITDIRNAIKDYVNGNFNLTTTKFQLDGLQIGENLYKSRLYTPINSIANYDIASFVLRRKNAQQSLEILRVDLNDLIQLEDISDIGITVQ